MLKCLHDTKMQKSLVSEKDRVITINFLYYNLIKSN